MIRIPLRSCTRALALGAAALFANLTVAVGADAAPTVTNRSVCAWGLNSEGQLGNGSKTDSAAPVGIIGLNSGVTAAVAGNLHTVVIQNGAVFICGLPNRDPVPAAFAGLGSGVTAVAAGSVHNLAIQNGAAMAWGSNQSGQLGDGALYVSSYDAPVAVNGLGSGVTAVACGAFHSLAVRNGAAYAWGDNSQGELGNGSTDRSTVPVPVNGLGSSVTAVAGGYYHSLAIQRGFVYAWGDNSYGELGYSTSFSNSTAPAPVAGLGSGVTSIAGGRYHSLAVRGGKVYAWGGNYYGQLGDSTASEISKPFQVDPTDLKNIVAVAAGQYSSYALDADGSLWVWGYDSHGELGLGNTTNYATPQHLLPPSGYVFSAVSASAMDEHAVAILSAVPPSTFFAGESYLGGGVSYLNLPNGNPFGYYAFLSDPNFIYHFDLGYEYVVDAADGQGGVFLYDFKSDGFFYTSPSFPFPYLYDFTLKTFLYYYPDPKNPGRYNTDGVRYFYNFATGQIISK